MTKSRGEPEKMTKDELVDYADNNNIEVQHAWLKDDIISAIVKGERATARQEAKQHAAEQYEGAEQHATGRHVVRRRGAEQPPHLERGLHQRGGARRLRRRDLAHRSQVGVLERDDVAAGVGLGILECGCDVVHGCARHAGRREDREPLRRAARRERRIQ